MKKPFVICIVARGRHAGKTTVLTKILGEMKRRGLAVGTIKHIGGHSEFVLPTKDTDKHIQAGSKVTTAVTSSEIVTIRRDLPNTLQSALSQMPKELDYILVEGFKQSEYPKIVVSNSESESTMKVPGDIIALILDQKQIAKGGKSDKVGPFSNESLVDAIQDYFNSSSAKNSH
jgi:molybdopterin-guanine dinucleotide biosynthesis protein MobB